MNENKKTLQAYEDNPQVYVNITPKEIVGDVKTWIDDTLEYLTAQSSILELGSGFGRDADYIESKGFTVIRSEAAKSFIKLMKQNGHAAILLNAISSDYGGPYDMIFASAVLLHFTPDETSQVLRKVHNALKAGGIFSFRLKQGTGSEWETDALGAPRFFQYWLAADLRKLLQGNSFIVQSLSQGYSKFNKFTWLQVIAKKAPKDA